MVTFAELMNYVKNEITDQNVRNQVMGALCKSCKNTFNWQEEQMLLGLIDIIGKLSRERDEYKYCPAKEGVSHACEQKKEEKW